MGSFYTYTYTYIERENLPASAYLLTFFSPAPDFASKPSVMAWNNFILRLWSSVSHHQLVRAEEAVAITLSDACLSICGIFLALLYSAPP